MAQTRMLEKNYALHKLIKLRQRYILTRGNKIRLRYMAFSVAVLFSAYGALSYILENNIETPSNMSEELSIEAENTHSISNIEETLQNHISDGIRRASAIIKKPPRPLYKNLKIGQGDTISGVLKSAGISGQDAYYAIKAMSKHYDPRQIKPGQEIRVKLKPLAEESVVGAREEIEQFTVNLSPIKKVTVVKNGPESFTAELHEAKLIKRSHAYTTEIETSLYGSATKAGIPAQVVAEMIRLYSWNVDFQRDIRRGDKIEILYETMETKDGDYARYGDVLFANLAVGGKDTPIYRYEMKDGRVDYFEPDGFSVRKTLMKTPVDGARLSSGFGMRKHPVLGYNKMHKGLDFAAPTGTPIYAAGDGTIEVAGRNGGYGNYVRIRHNSSLKTAYAHMHKFGRGISAGKRVEQGDVIGYVGTTGRSTGPHLHYEVLVNNTHKNPKSIDLPTGEQLEGQELKRFTGLMSALKAQYASLNNGIKLASNL